MPSPVDKYFEQVKKDNPSYTDEQAWATAWSIYCKYKNPGSESCHQDEYLTGKTAALNIMERMQLLSAFQVLSMGSSGGYGISARQARDVIEKVTGVYIDDETFPPKGLSVDQYIAWLKKYAAAGGDEVNFTASDALAADDYLKKVLAKLAVAKKAVAAMPESEAKKLVDDAMELHKEASDLFQEQHRTKGNYYEPVDPSLVERLKDLYKKVLDGLKVLARIDSKGAPAQLTKDLSTFGHMGLRLDTLSEAAGLAYTIDNKARLVLFKAKRAAEQVKFYTNWVDSYKTTGAPPSLNDQWGWMRDTTASNPVREFQDAIITRNVVARVMRRG